MDTDLKELRISAAIDAASAATNAAYPKLVQSGMRPLLDCTDAGQVFAIDETGRPRFGKHGQMMGATELANRLMNDPGYSAAWGCGR